MLGCSTEQNQQNNIPQAFVKIYYKCSIQNIKWFYFLVLLLDEKKIKIKMSKGPETQNIVSDES